VIQNSLSSITYRIVKTDDHAAPTQPELDEIAEKTRLGMGQDCDVNFEFVQEIPAGSSEKYRYIICEASGPEGS